MIKTKPSLVQKECTSLVNGLTVLLADTYMLYLKTQNFHWNVTGPHFFSLHKLFEEQYLALAAAIDELAERIRALGAHTPASFSYFLKISSLDEPDEHVNADNMVKILLRDHEMLAKSLVKLCKIAEDGSDEVTLDLLIERKSMHDKTAWMLKSTLGR
jgi:starvation-inducible DNA-binding protein